MVKTINVSFDDDEFEDLIKMKREKSWRLFILDMTKDYVSDLEEELN